MSCQPSKGFAFHKFVIKLVIKFKFFFLFAPQDTGLLEMYSAAKGEDVHTREERQRNTLYPENPWALSRRLELLAREGRAYL